jgi:hypothetical protein
VTTEQKTYRQILASFRTIFAPRFNSLAIERGAVAAATHIASRGAVGATHDFLRLCINESDLDEDAKSDQVTVEHMALAFERLNSGERSVYNPFTVKELPEHWCPLPFDAGARQKATSTSTSHPSSARREAA